MPIMWGLAIGAAMVELVRLINVLFWIRTNQWS